MAGTLTVSTLYDSSGVLATQNGMSGIAKAWVNFNGYSTITVRGSFNVSSVTRNSSGNYTINFTTAFPDTNYSAVGTGISTTTTNNSWGVSVQGTTSTGPTNKTTSAITVLNGSFAGGSVQDSADNNWAFFR